MADTAFLDGNETNLPPIPLVDLGEAQPAVALLRLQPERIAAILEEARRVFPPSVLAWGERRSKAWLMRNDTPYCADVAAVAATLDQAGGWFLNLNYEWACTGAVFPEEIGPAAGCPLLLRTLDWRIAGLGKTLTAVRRHSAAGPWVDVTWPGFVGVLQAMAPGRFAAAIIQAPLARRSGLFLLDWLLARRAISRSRAVPPTHLLRQAFETAPDFTSARQLLAQTPIAAPAIFLLAGDRPGDGAIIERLQTQERTRVMPAVAANHWRGFQQRAWSRGIDSEGRERCLAATAENPASNLVWHQEPVTNALTRLTFSAVPATGSLTVQGYEGVQPVTAPLCLGASRSEPENHGA